LPPPPLDLSTFDGVRVLSLSLVVLGHAFFFPLALTGFSNGILQEAGKAAFQVIPSAELAVDTFFCLSGALGALLMTKGLRKALAAASAAAAPRGAAAVGAVAPAAYAPLPALAAVVAVDGSGGRSSLQRPLIAPGSLNSGGGGGGGGEEEDAGRGGGNDGGMRAASPDPLRPRSALVALTLGGAALQLLAHRWLRLVPSVLTLILVYAYLAPLTASGPLWGQWQGGRDQCTKYWWTNALFINNFTPGSAFADNFGQECVGWLWYLAIDWQLYVVALLPLTALGAAASLRAATVLTSVALAGCIAATAAIIAVNKITFIAVAPPASLSGDGSDLFYTKPWTRAPAFLIGVLLGLALLAYEDRQEAAAAAAAAEDGPEEGDMQKELAPEQQDEEEEEEPPCNPAAVLHLLLPTRAAAGSGKASLRRRRDHRNRHQAAPAAVVVDWRAAGALAACLLAMGLLFYLPTGAYAGALAAAGVPGSPDPSASPWSDDAQMAWTAIVRPLWAAALGGLLYLCATRRGGLIGAGLALPLWRPLARLSFQAYLYHPLVLSVTGAAVVALPRYDRFWLASTFVATAAFSVVLGAVMHLLVELPAAAGSKWLLGGCGRGGRDGGMAD